MREGLLPAEVAEFDGDCGGQVGLDDFELGAAGDLAEGDCDLNYAGQGGVFELVGVLRR